MTISQKEIKPIMNIKWGKFVFIYCFIKAHPINFTWNDDTTKYCTSIVGADFEWSSFGL